MLIKFKNNDTNNKNYKAIRIKSRGILFYFFTVTEPL